MEIELKHYYLENEALLLGHHDCEANGLFGGMKESSGGSGTALLAFGTNNAWYQDPLNSTEYHTSNSVMYMWWTVLQKRIEAIHVHSQLIVHNVIMLLFCFAFLLVHFYINQVCVYRLELFLYSFNHTCLVIGWLFE